MVANATGDSITLMDPKTGEVQRTLTGIVDPYQLQFSPDMKWFVTAANRLDHIDIYAEAAGKGLRPEAGQAHPGGQDAQPHHDRRQEHHGLRHAAGQRPADRHRPATQTPKWTVSVGKTPADVFLTPDQKTLLVA